MVSLVRVRVSLAEIGIWYSLKVLQSVVSNVVNGCVGVIFGKDIASHCLTCHCDGKYNFVMCEIQKQVIILIIIIIIIIIIVIK